MNPIKRRAQSRAVNSKRRVAKTLRRNLFEQLEQRQLLAAGINPVVFVPGFAGTFADVVDTSGNLIAEPTLSERLDESYTNRGLHPDKLALEPHGQVYQSMVQTLDNVGYVSAEDIAAGSTDLRTLFVTTWDWRVPVAPVDGVINGSLAATYADITDATFDTGLDYLAHTLEQVKAIHGDNVTVDIVTHSTGGLIARSYLQSEAYQNRATTGFLPTVDNLVMAGVPNRGVADTWNLSLDDWAGSAATRSAARLIDNSYDLLQAGTPISGPGSSSITDTAIDKQVFVQQYVGALRGLLPEYPVMDLDNNGSLVAITSANTTETNLFNDLLIDLNFTGNDFIDQAVNTSIIYSTEVDTNDRIV